MKGFWGPLVIIGQLSLITPVYMLDRAPLIISLQNEHRGPGNSDAAKMFNNMLQICSWVSCRAPDCCGAGDTTQVSRIHGSWGQSTLFHRHKTGRVHEESLKPTKSVQAIHLPENPRTGAAHELISKTARQHAPCDMPRNLGERIETQ